MLVVIIVHKLTFFSVPNGTKKKRDYGVLHTWYASLTPPSIAQYLSSSLELKATIDRLPQQYPKLTATELRGKSYAETQKFYRDKVGEGGDFP